MLVGIPCVVHYMEVSPCCLHFNAYNENTGQIIKKKQSKRIL